MQLSFIPLALPADQDLLIRWLTSESWPFHVNLHPTQAMVLNWIQSGIFTGPNHQTFWIRADASDPIGLIRLYDLDDVDDGYPLFDLRIQEAYRRQGIGQQSVQWLTSYLFETWPQLDRIVGTTREDNVAMQRVFQACGYVKEGHFRKDWRIAGHRYDALQYAILREDWETQTVTPVAWDNERALTWKIRPYRPTDEAQWLRCRVLAFLDTAYFDNVYREKEHYANPSVELVAELDGHIIGLIDIECEEEPGSVCSPPATLEKDGKAGMIWHLAVHPDYRHQGVGKALLEAAIALAQPFHLQRLEAWTRDDAATLRWYEAQGFEKIESYWHVYLDGDEVDTTISSAMPGLKPRHVFAHYHGDAAAHLQQRFRRVHECSRYDLILK
jgi:RimJ/RimL family protein N-acetyltransferase